MHYEVGKKVRKAIIDIGGTLHENFETPKKSLKELEKNEENIFNVKEGNLINDGLHFILD